MKLIIENINKSFNKKEVLRGASYESGSKYSDLILNIIGLACLLFLIIGAVLIYKLAPKRVKIR